MNLNLAGPWALKCVPVVSCFTILIYCLAFCEALWISPPDILQGEYVRIMYVHVSSAWVALGIYVCIGIASIFTVLYDNPISDIYAYSLAPIGAVFCLICLITGSIWGKPVWGTWWVWDSRLTSMLILLFLYIGYILLWGYRISSSKTAAILSIVGLINIPVIKYSVKLWNSIHQDASITIKKVSIDSSMLIPLALMFIASAGLTFCIWAIRVEIIKAEKQKFNTDLRESLINKS